MLSRRDMLTGSFLLPSSRIGYVRRSVPITYETQNCGICGNFLHASVDEDKFHNKKANWCDSYHLSCDNVKCPNKGLKLAPSKGRLFVVEDNA